MSKLYEVSNQCVGVKVFNEFDVAGSGCFCANCFTNGSTDPMTPASGYIALYAKNQSMFIKDALGNVTDLAGGGGGSRWLLGPTGYICPCNACGIRVPYICTPLIEGLATGLCTCVTGGDMIFDVSQGGVARCIILCNSGGAGDLTVCLLGGAGGNGSFRMTGTGTFGCVIATSTGDGLCTCGNVCAFDTVTATVKGRFGAGAGCIIICGTGCCFRINNILKAATIQYDPEHYAVLKVEESPDVWFHDRGSDCLCYHCKEIPLDSIYRKVTEPEYLVQVTPMGNAHLFVAEKKPESFIVCSDQDVSFDWQVSAIRKGYKNFRWIHDHPLQQDDMNTLEVYEGAQCAPAS
jgi:hypothetical protein